MNKIAFSEVGVRVNSEEELEDITNMYTLLGIELSESYERDCENAKHDKFRGWFIQTDLSDVSTPSDIEIVAINIVRHPIKYVIDKVDFAFAFQLLKSEQLGELEVYLDKHCKEYK